MELIEMMKISRFNEHASTALRYGKSLCFCAFFFCVCAWINQLKTFTHKGHTGNGLATISCQGGHGPVCANVVVPSNPIQH